MQLIKALTSPICLALGLVLTVTSCTNDTAEMTIERRTLPAISTPVAPQVENIVNIHGYERSDPYKWMEDKEDPRLLDYLAQENAYRDSITAAIKPLEEKIYEEVLARIEETDLSVPVKDGEYYYYTRTEEGQEYSIRCRKKGSLDGPEEVLLDGNQLAGDSKQFRIGGFAISTNHKLLAYSTDYTGKEENTIFIKNLETGILFPEKIEKTGSVTWAADNKTIFYTKYNEKHRPSKIYRHTLGTPVSSDVLVHEETDEKMYCGIGRTKDDKYMVLSVGNVDTDERRYTDAINPNGVFKMVTPREETVEYNLTHLDGYWYKTTNKDALNFKLVKCKTEHLNEGQWEEVIPHSDKSTIRWTDGYKDYLVISGRKDGRQNLSVLNLKNGTQTDLEMPEEVYNVRLNPLPNFDENTIRLNYSSPITPRSVYDVPLATGEWKLQKEYKVLGEYDKNQYKTDRIWATVRDGTKVPISLVYDKNLKLNGKNPLYLYGYGCYGSNTDPWFSASRLSLLERGFVYAVAHVRGGGEMGNQWKEDGHKEKRMNAFTDFVDCAEHLIKKRYTNKDMLVSSGRSAGGLLVGAAANLRPDLFEVVIAGVPVVDIMARMLDSTSQRAIYHYPVYGNPHDKKFYDYISAYSAVENVQEKEYPNMLVTGGLNDPRVKHFHPAKYMANLRNKVKTGNAQILKMDMGAGHFGAAARYKAIRETAFEYAFVLDRLGMGQVEMEN